ncbi:MAG: hypothetical protein M1819_003315 [Sarea resinae]|nr:MAG: hypothetical protein M1819_003315 [Sarea resinae]
MDDSTRSSKRRRTGVYGKPKRLSSLASLHFDEEEDEEADNRLLRETFVRDDPVPHHGGFPPSRNSFVHTIQLSHPESEENLHEESESLSATFSNERNSHSSKTDLNGAARLALSLSSQKHTRDAPDALEHESPNEQIIQALNGVSTTERSTTPPGIPSTKALALLDQGLAVGTPKEAPEKRKRGRPRKYPKLEDGSASRSVKGNREQDGIVAIVESKRGHSRGRPRKSANLLESTDQGIEPETGHLNAPGTNGAAGRLSEDAKSVDEVEGSAAVPATQTPGKQIMADITPTIRLGEEESQLPRSSGRERRKPRTYSPEVNSAPPKTVATSLTRPNLRTPRTVFISGQRAEYDADRVFNPDDLPSDPIDATKPKASGLREHRSASPEGVIRLEQRPLQDHGTHEEDELGLTDNPDANHHKDGLDASLLEGPAPPKRKRGRPPKQRIVQTNWSSKRNSLDLVNDNAESSVGHAPELSSMGRSSLASSTVNGTSEPPRKKRGRPPKQRLVSSTTPFETNTTLSDTSRIMEPAEEPADIEDTFNLRSLLRSDLPEDMLALQLHAVKNVVLQKITGKRRTPLIGLDDEYSKVQQVVSNTVIAGEGNSMLLIGARGTAKSMLVETVIDDLKGDADNDDFYVVRLNGFIQTDDKLALREIWRQLGKEMDVEDDMGRKTTNYADTLASLLALLSHPAELTNGETQTQDDATVSSKSIVFLLSEFDLFASHPRQTLLYNLFDIAQSRKAPIAVLGMTTRVDVVEMLEKRVKSRFGHRVVFFGPARSLNGFWEAGRSALTVGEEELYSSQCASDSEDRDVLKDEDGLRFVDAWGKMIEHLPTTPAFSTHLRRTYTQTKSIPALLTSFLTPLSSLSPSSLSLASIFARIPTPRHLLQPPDSNLHMLPSLSDLELSLLIAAARLDILTGSSLVTYEMAYAEYVSLASRARVSASSSTMATSSSLATAAAATGIRVWGRDVAVGAWESLGRCGLLVPAGVASYGSSGGGIAGGGQQGVKGGGAGVWRVDVALEEIAPSFSASGGLSGWMARWCREL